MGGRNERASWNTVGCRSEESMEGNRRKPRRVYVRREEKFRRYKTEIEERIETRERLALRNKVKSGKHLEIYGGLSEGIGMKTYVHGPMDFAKMLKRRFRVGVT